MRISSLFLALILVGPLSAMGQTSLDQRPGGARLVSDDVKLKPPPFWMNYQGKLYQNVELTGVEGDVAVFSTSLGPLRIKWSEAPGALQSRFVVEYKNLVDKASRDAAKAAADAARQQAIADGVQPMAWNTPVQVDGFVVQKIPDGLLIVYGKQPALLCGLPNEASLSENDTVSAATVYKGWFQYLTTDGAVATVRKLQVTQPNSPQ